MAISRIGLDIGSTTLKIIVLDENNSIIYKEYERHYSQITEKAASMLENLHKKYPECDSVKLCISGSAGMGLATDCDIPFIQEVYATRISVTKLLPGTDVVIELGGEDAKILFLTNGLEVRMNGSCAGGTGAFIDQMATLLNISAGELNELSKDYEKVYTIASRCGVFAKSDIQPLLNQGAKKNDIAASIFAAVVNQTVAGLAQGRPITGKVVYLGGPLTFMSELRKAFDNILKIKGISPDNSLYYVAIGAAYSEINKTTSLSQAIEKIKSYISSVPYNSSLPLFTSQAEYDAFKAEHNKNQIEIKNIKNYSGDAYLGIDAGSTTVKAVVLDTEGTIIKSVYLPNSGNPVPLIKDFLTEMYNESPDIHILSSAVTGYGEEIIKNAFSFDYGVVETIAHYTAAKAFRPDVDFIIDIGGQDIKCFKLHNSAIDNIFLNEACSSGCGSFLQTFAGALGYSIQEFASLGIFADKPVDLGSRCTVFMNSSVKQAQKDGASIENISAGLSLSVVKNALYKVIRATSVESLGNSIVVQGGTFLNDAVLRAFEMETKRKVVRPSIAGLMGAYGAALYCKKKGTTVSTLITADKLKAFTHSVKVITCKGCPNSCRLTVNTFDNNRKYIGGNRCEKPLAKATATEIYNLYDYKRQLLESYKSNEGTRGTIGIPMVLNMYELLPFWCTFFKKLGFSVITSPESNRKLYLKGQHTIPSDTVCFPAKLVHGHIEWLIEQNPDAIFYPCLTYNFDEHLGDNHFNCPVVAYYPEVIKANVDKLKTTKFIYDYLGIHKKKHMISTLQKILDNAFGNITLSEVHKAVNAAFLEYERYMQNVRDKAQEYISIAKSKKIPVVVLAGRPYHLDPEVSHGIDKLICECGAAVITEDSVSHLYKKFNTKVLNQWTYHSRLYASAKYAVEHDDTELVQLVSFGCGVDAITTDEVRSILEASGKIYTQIKIDEITNLGAVKIRLRSLFAAMHDENRRKS